MISSTECGSVSSDKYRFSLPQKRLPREIYAAFVVTKVYWPVNDLYYWYILLEVPMAPKSAVNKKDIHAKLFWNGRSQAVRLPKEFRFEGDSVRVRRMGAGVLLEPVKQGKKESTEEWFARIDALRGDPIFPEGRKQKLAPIREYFK